MAKCAGTLDHLANHGQRKGRSAAHAAFDPLWRTGGMNRREAYDWLSGKLGIHWRDCHTGQFDWQQCQRVLEVMSIRSKISPAQNRIPGEGQQQS